MTTIDKIYSFDTLGKLIELWTNNKSFNKQVGPTVGHLYYWMRLNGIGNLVVTEPQHFSEATLQYNTENEVEVFLCEIIKGKNISKDKIVKYVFPYIESIYLKEGVSFFQKYIETKVYDYSPSFLSIESVTDYIIAHNIRLDNIVPNNDIFWLRSYEKAIKLFDLGMCMSSDFLDRQVRYHPHCEKIFADNHIMFNNITIERIFMNMTYQGEETLECYRKVFFACKDIDKLWTPTINTRKACLNKRYQNLYKNRKNIETDLEFAYNFIIVEEKFMMVLSDVRSVIYNHIVSFIEKGWISADIVNHLSHMPLIYDMIMNMIQKDRHQITKLLNIGVKLFDEHGFLLKNKYGNSVNYYTNYTTSYNILTDFYSDNNEMINKINFAYKNYVNKTNLHYVVIAEEQEEEKEKSKEDIFTTDVEIKKLYDSISDQRMKDKLIAYTIKLALKQKK